MASLRKKNIRADGKGNFPVSILKGFFHGSSGNTIGLHPVPIKEIFEMEAKLIGMGAQKAKERERDYERYVSRLVDAVRGEHRDIAIETAERRTNNIIVQNVPSLVERKLIENIINTFKQKFGARYRSGAKLIESVANNEFNCYSSGVVMADVFYRLDIPAGIVTAWSIAIPGHVTSRTQRYLVETTRRANPIHEAEKIALYYKIAYDVGVDELPGVAWYSHGIKMARGYRINEAVEAFDRALELMPGNIVVEFEKANILDDYKSISRWYR